MVRYVTIADFYRNQWEEIKSRILKEPDIFLVGTSTDELVEFYFSNNRLTPIEINPDRDETFEHRKEMRLVET